MGPPPAISINTSGTSSRIRTAAATRSCRPIREQAGARQRRSGDPWERPNCCRASACDSVDAKPLAVNATGHNADLLLGDPVRLGQHARECLRQHDEVTCPAIDTPFDPELGLSNDLAITLYGAFRRPGPVEVDDDRHPAKRLEHRERIQSEMRAREVVLRSAALTDEIARLQQSQGQWRIVTRQTRSPSSRWTREARCPRRCRLPQHPREANAESD